MQGQQAEFVLVQGEVSDPADGPDRGLTAMATAHSSAAHRLATAELIRSSWMSASRSPGHSPRTSRHSRSASAMSPRSFASMARFLRVTCP
jgi:hypothetical protein